jgi:hypothetical protein
MVSLRLVMVGGPLFTRGESMPKKTYNPGDFVDHDDVVLSSAALAAWSGIASRAAAFCQRLKIPAEELPDEQLKLNADGSISVEIEIKTPSGGGVTFDMNVPAGEWQWKQ